MARRRNKKQEQDDETLVDLGEALGSASSFLERNQIAVFGGLAAVVLIVGGLFVYRNFIVKPRQVEAVDQMSQAQIQFSRDSFALALTNPGGGYMGFVDIVDNFKGTKAANIANYYAGISYLHLGEYVAALDYLNAFKPDGEVLPIMKFGAMGDAFSELQDLDKALEYYERAVDQGENQVLVPYYLKKIGMLNERNGDMEAAHEAYSRIKKEFPSAPDARDIEKYIARVETKS